MKIRDELAVTLVLLFVFGLGLFAGSAIARNQPAPLRPVTVTVYAAKGQDPVKTAGALIRHVESLPGFNR